MHINTALTQPARIHGPGLNNYHYIPCVSPSHPPMLTPLYPIQCPHHSPPNSLQVPNGVQYRLKHPTPPRFSTGVTLLRPLSNHHHPQSRFNLTTSVMSALPPLIPRLSRSPQDSHPYPSNKSQSPLLPSLPNGHIFPHMTPNKVACIQTRDAWGLLSNPPSHSA